MLVSKEELRKLIKEEYKRALQEQPPQSGVIQPQQPNQSQQQKVDPKQTLRNNASQQLKLLRFMKETLKQMKMPQELENMIAHIKKNGTPEFLSQVLNVEKSIPVNIAAALTNPIELIQSIIDEVLKSAIQKANQKLAEGKEEFNSILEENIEIENLEEISNGEFHVEHDAEQKLEKHKKKEMKKQLKKHKKEQEIPLPNLSPEDMEKFKELSKK